MQGTNKKSSRSLRKQNIKGITEEEPDATAGRCTERVTDNGGREGGGDSEIMKAILDLTREVQGLKEELKQDFSKFKDEIKKEIKAELNNMKADMEQKFTEATAEIVALNTRMSAAEQRVADLETVNIDLRDALLHSLKQHKSVRTQLISLEGRQKRNSIRIFGIDEDDCDAGSVTAFITDFIKKELELEADVELGIQTALRSTAPKPQKDEPPRSVIVNFQQSTMKDQILKTAWTKKIKYGDRVVNFTHDLPAEVNKMICHKNDNYTRFIYVIISRPKYNCDV